MQADLEALFPSLIGSGYRRTSLPTIEYNCIAWAAGEARGWWEPDPYGLWYWPPGAPRAYTQKGYIAAFASRGYTRCKDADLRDGYEKIAIYVLNGFPQHAARQLRSGIWTSKLGDLDDISHSLSALEGDRYGTPRIFMQRKLEA
ncbi:MAG: hypothetical protein IAF94_16730 [Pirellulaceae bacterium]|nr:hypothetical protein [Pirellulaceae bacterium]